MLNVLSSAGATILACAYLLPLGYLVWSLFCGAARAGQSLGRDRPGMADAIAAADREFHRDAVVTAGPYAYPPPESMQQHV